MITEQDREKAQIEKISNGIRLCEESIAKAEKYERLSENKDWKQHQEDLKILVGMHEKEIALAATMIPDAPGTGYIKDDKYVSSKSDWTDFITVHEVQRVQLTRWLKEPSQIITMAAIAREKLPLLKEKLAELTHGSETNGKS